MRHSIVAIPLGVAVLSACGGHPLTKIASNWYVDQVPPGRPSPHLYWVEGSKPTLVDREISAYAMAGCLLYETSRPSMSKVVFGVLPNKIPVPVTSSDAFRPFRLTLEGLRRFDLPRTSENGVLTLDMDFIASSDICSQAYTQPVFTEDWATKQPLDFSRVKVQHIELAVNGADSVGNSTLSDEIRQRHDDVVDELISAGANVNTANNSGVTPLMGAIAANLESTRVLQRLLDAGAEIDDQDKGGLTALMYAARYRRKEAVKLLLAKGANPTIRDNQGRTAAAHLSNYADAELTTLLEQSAAQHK